jgi:hypothetical protein
MPRRIIKRYIPNPETIRDHKHLRFLGTLLHDPNILHLNRRSVSGAFVVGLFWAFIPVPFQMVFAAVTAIAARVNLPISVALVWLTNPLTMGPVYYFTYKLGSWILDRPMQKVQFELSYEWVTHELSLIWEPFLLGCFVTSAVSAILGYVFVRLFWRLHVTSNWKRRIARRRAAKAKE